MGRVELLSRRLDLMESEREVTANLVEAEFEVSEARIERKFSR